MALGSGNRNDESIAGEEALLLHVDDATTELSWSTICATFVMIAILLMKKLSLDVCVLTVRGKCESNKSVAKNMGSSRSTRQQF